MPWISPELVCALTAAAPRPPHIVHVTATITRAAKPNGALAIIGRDYKVAPSRCRVRRAPRLRALFRPARGGIEVDDRLRPAGRDHRPQKRQAAGLVAGIAAFERLLVRHLERRAVSLFDRA